MLFYSIFHYGSTNGGTDLWIRGIGFVPSAFNGISSSNTNYKVQFVNNYTVYDCIVYTDGITDTRLPCYTTAMPVDRYLVRVYVNNSLIPLTQYPSLYYAYFNSSQMYTPMITGISSITRLSQRLISVSGDFKTKCYSRDTNECLPDNIPIISRVYIGDQRCSLIDPIRNTPYANITNTSLLCRYESNEVGSLIVTYTYGRSSTALNVYQLSAIGQLYTFQTYAVISNISPNNGSINGGTVLTITGQYFSDNNQYPLSVNVADTSCTILSVSSTTIQFHLLLTKYKHKHISITIVGGRGLHRYYENIYLDLDHWANSTPPMPGINANKTWIEEASFYSANLSMGTVWFIGYLRPPRTANFTFQLDTNVSSILYLSTDENQDNIVQIRIMYCSDRIFSSSYYMICMGSSQRGAFRLSIKVKMVDGKTTIGSGNTGLVDIQKIMINSPDRIIYTTNTSIVAVSEVQHIPIISDPFQIGFRGVYTVIFIDSPTKVDAAKALNDLPTIHPLQVTVEINYNSYRIIFPIEMGDVPLLTIITINNNYTQNATEITKGVSSGSHFALELDGATTQYFDILNGTITNTILENQFQELFTIRCPLSLYNKDADSSIVYTNDFETNSPYDETLNVQDMAFCGRHALTIGNLDKNLVTENLEVADYLCFAYKIPQQATNITLYFQVESDLDFDTTTIETLPIPVSLVSDNYWHYKCIKLRETFEDFFSSYLRVSWFSVKNVFLDSSSNDFMFDTVTLRTNYPFGYEDADIISISDQSASNPCTFPFVYNGKSYTRCTLNEENIPICRSSTNETYYCQNSSIEGVRRFYPQYQLLYNSLRINHSSRNRTIDISFQYTTCRSPTMIKTLPSTFANVTSITKTSEPIEGTYDIEFDGEIYSSIPVTLTGTEMTNLFQSFAKFGYVSVIRTGVCPVYSYNISWFSKAKQPLISIINTTNIRPNSLSISASSIQVGNDGNTFYNLPNDMIRTYHNIPQVEVLVNGLPSYCSNGDNNCPFQFSNEQTPMITSIEQNGTSLIITGDGFSSSVESNKVSIGEQGLCNVTDANMTFIMCTIVQSPSGPQIVQVNVIDKGFVSSSINRTINVPLTIDTFNPSEGGVGGGYSLTINGVGFSLNTKVTVDGNLCSNSQIINFSSIICTVPSSTIHSDRQVIISVIDNEKSVNASSLFTYNITDRPFIVSIQPTVVTMLGGKLNISGIGFRNQSLSVYVGSKKAVILSASNTLIQINLPELSAGLHPIVINTSTGLAQSSTPVEYRFYIQQISPQIGSLYGGSDIYVSGEGFHNSTIIQFRNQNNRLLPCDIMSIQSDQIFCRTPSFVQQVTITADGIDPLYGAGFAWSPQHQTIQQGTIVTWKWDLLANLLTRRYKIQQLDNAYSTIPTVNGFDSGVATSSGTFSFQFNSLGTFYYWSPLIVPYRDISIRGIIDVIASEPDVWTTEVISNHYMAQTCVFPFTYDSVNYTSCTSVNDTRLWCSPTSIYTGQRFYCVSQGTSDTTNCIFNSYLKTMICLVPVLNAACSPNVSNKSLCNQTLTTSLQPTQFLATLCTLNSLISVSPTIGTIGTLLTITGMGFDGDMCEYDIQIGSSYHCPIMNMTSTELICEITSNSMLNGSTNYLVRVARDRYGYLKSQDQLQFAFQASILNITPMTGSIYGGTEVTIDGVGFIPNYTRIYIANQEYTNLANITYSKIVLQTLPATLYINHNATIVIGVRDYPVRCSIASCQFAWLTSVTPYLDSVTPQVINGPTNLTFTGRNLVYNSNITDVDTHLYINDNPCNVMEVTNESLTCFIVGIEMGVHRIVGFIDGVGKIGSSINITSKGNLISLSPTTNGIYGGTKMIIIGYGFSNTINHVLVMVGLNLCPVIHATKNEIHCNIPAQGNNSNQVNVTVIINNITLESSLLFTYNISVTPIVTSVNATTDNISTVLSIYGNNFIAENTTVLVGSSICVIVNMSSTFITCAVSTGLSAGRHKLVVHVDDIGDSNSDLFLSHHLLVTRIFPTEGGYGGGLPVTIDGDGFNSTNISVSVCNRSCLSVRTVSNTQLICITPSIAINGTNNPCNLTVTVDDMYESIIFTYAANLTTIITSITPKLGGTGGGTKVTINGTNFPNSSDVITVTIDNTICENVAVNLTSITCETGSHYQTNLNSLVHVSINGEAYAAGNVTFQYIDRWSSPWTWGGDVPPEADTIVSIENGTTVYLDISTPILKALVIDNATLIFDDSQNIALNAEFIIIVNGGRLQIGTESDPFQHRAVITMYGYLDSDILPVFGSKVLGVRNGILDMHGKTSVNAWAKLEMTAVNGSSTITLPYAVGWPNNSKIIIATTGDFNSQIETEVRQIIDISTDGRTLTIDTPLNYTHVGVSRQLNTTTIEVHGTFTTTRNQSKSQCTSSFTRGRYDSGISADKFGATIMVSPDTQNIDTQHVIIRISNVELFNVGQVKSSGENRYPIYLHKNGNMSMSYVKSSSIHLSYNRAINIHATNYMTIENNVIYDIMGHGIFLNDGFETGNIFRSNLLVSIQSSSYSNEKDLIPAAFWLSNPNNILEHNAVVGSTHHGYWYQLLEIVDKFSNNTNEDFYPHKQPLGRFYNNSVHSTGLYGLWIYPQYKPTISGNSSDNRALKAIFEGLVSWKNRKGMEYVMSKPIQIKDALVFDNIDVGIHCISGYSQIITFYSGFLSRSYNDEDTSSILNSIIIGHLDDSNQYITESTVGLIVPGDRDFPVHNVTFINFVQYNISAIRGPLIADYCKDQCGGFLMKFSNISFINVQNRIKFRWDYDGIYKDEDGTLTSQNESMMVLARNGLTNGSSSCVLAPQFENAVQCSLSNGSWVRMTLTENYNADWNINHGPLLISDENNHTTNVAWSALGFAYLKGYVTTLQVNRTYQLSFPDLKSLWSYAYYWITLYDMNPGDYIIFNHKLESKPDRMYSYESSTPLSGVNSDHGAYFYDNQTHIFSYISMYIYQLYFFCLILFYLLVKNSAILNTINDAHMYYRWNLLHCLEDADWTEYQYYPNWYQRKPGDYKNITIPWCHHLIIDQPLPRIQTLRIEGVLEFQRGRNHTMYVDNIVIDGGRLVAGSELSPFNENIDIILTDKSVIKSIITNQTRSIYAPFTVDQSGLDLHGLSHDVIWTRLAITAHAGNNTISLSEPVDWKVGDEFVITTTDTNISHTERHRIASLINSTIIRTTQPLSYTHIVLRHAFPNGSVVNIAAAVGLLTRNIRMMSTSSIPNLSGFKISIVNGSSNYKPDIFHMSLSNIQFIGFGEFADSSESDDKSGLYIQNLNGSYSRWPSYIHQCSFDGGFNAAISTKTTHFISISNNVIYNTYRSAIVITGRNNIIQNNLVTTIYWTGTAQNSTVAQINKNYDGAIMSHNAGSVVMKNNLVAGVERVAYRIQGDACSSTLVPTYINNSYSNNEVHSAMVGVSIWPRDKGFFFDRRIMYPSQRIYNSDIVLFLKSIRVYKAWYYGFYINTFRNITIDSCTSIDNHVGIFTFVIGPSPLSHVIFRSRVTVKNSIVIGAMIPNDCGDKIVLNTLNIKYSTTAMPTVSQDPIIGGNGSRSGIVFPIFSPRNNMPDENWSETKDYPCLDGSMSITNTILAFFNNVCNRHDTAIQVSQSNADVQFPITTSSIFRYNVSNSNILFNGKPDLKYVQPQFCNGMDCDGQKKNVVKDIDGTLLDKSSSATSQSEIIWNNRDHGIGDWRIPPAARTDLFGREFNISEKYPYRGISRSGSCAFKPAWQMYMCDYMTNYYMLIIESMDDDTEKRSLAPVAIMSASGYIDLISGPRHYPNGNTEIRNRRRISTFMAIVHSEMKYEIYLNDDPPKHIRFRLINSNSSVRCILAFYYKSLQQIDIYANNIYVSPTNRDPQAGALLLLDEPNKVNLSSPSGSNYFDRTYRLVYFLIDGNTTIELKQSPLLFLDFGIPPMNESTFFTTNVANNLAAVFRFDPVKIRRVKIVRESRLSLNGDEFSRVIIEIRDDPRTKATSTSGVSAEVLSNIASAIINSYQSGELKKTWADLNFTNGTSPFSLSVQEPFNYSTANLSIINRTKLKIVPDQCRQQSPCTIQPVLFASDSEDNIIQKLGSNDRPWQVKATIVNQPNVILPGAIANYTEGQTQYSLFGLPDIGVFEVQFTFIQPDGVNRTNLTVRSDPITVTNASLAGQQINNTYVIDIDQTFDISIILIDNITRRQIGKTQWDGWTWTANVTLYTLPKFHREGTLIKPSSSRSIISEPTKPVTIPDFTINSLGMFILNIRLVSTNNEHVITLTSNGILVKNKNNDDNDDDNSMCDEIISIFLSHMFSFVDAFVTDVRFLSNNITFINNYDALQASNLLEIKRAMIYNYLLEIGMPLISDVVIVEGEMVFLFQVDSLSVSISKAVESILSDPRAIPGLTVSSVYINGRSYYVSSEVKNTESNTGNNIGLIVGIVIALVVVVIVVVVAGLYWVQKKKNAKDGNKYMPGNIFPSI
uniref:Fibrocystin-like protein n=1 Tax=Adineta vaga TaxID=104782 RepID=B3G452_ADIVA|nr:fibrocystin-like protein [Adineta vaga]